MKCEIEGCTDTTDNFLCEKHRKLAESKNAKFKICKHCNVIIAVWINNTIEKNRYTFIEECETCKFN